MGFKKNLNKGRPEVSKTPLECCKKEWLTDSLKVNPSDSISLCTGVLLPTTSTYSFASSTVTVTHSPGVGRVPTALIKSRQATDECTSKSAATHAVSIRTDSGFSNLAPSALLRIIQPRPFRTTLQLLNRDITGLTRIFSLASSSNLSNELTLRWADIFYNHNTLLTLTDKNFFSFKIEARGY